VPTDCSPDDGAELVVLKGSELSERLGDRGIELPPRNPATRGDWLAKQR
jgi:hypothetical protein